MTDGLPSPPFDARRYERPNRKWICGWASEGKPCGLGPDSKGRCRATFECTPYLNPSYECKPVETETKGEFRCGRLDPKDGKAPMPCAEGPTPEGKCCHPLKATDGKVTGRWECTRPKPLGGACDHGPFPDGTCCRPIPKCHPVRSLRGKRGLLTGSVILVTVAGLLVALYGP